MNKAIVLFSGGLDSLIHLHWAARQPQFDSVETLFVNLGHRYSRAEFLAADRLGVVAYGKRQHVLNLPLGFAEQADGFIPLRNMMLLSLATYFADNVVFGMLYNEGPPDKRPGFVKRMAGELNCQYAAKSYLETSRHIRIWTPFALQTKTEMLQWYLAHGGEPELALLSIGCFSAKGKCGRCMSCFHRWVAFQNCGLHETYAYPVARWALEQAAIGRHKRTNLLGLGQLWFKRRMIAESYRAYRAVMPRTVNPLSVLFKLRRGDKIDWQYVLREA